MSSAGPAPPGFTQQQANRRQARPAPSAALDFRAATRSAAQSGATPLRETRDRVQKDTIPNALGLARKVSVPSQQIAETPKAFGVYILPDVNSSPDLTRAKIDSIVVDHPVPRYRATVS